MREVHPIEAKSYEILRSRVETSHLPRYTRAVVEGVIHASADPDYAADLVCDEEALERAVHALAAGAPIVADARMVAVGITGRDVVCKMDESLTTRLARTAGITRSAAAVRLAGSEVGPAAVWAIGCAPTALEEMLSRGIDPALVIGLPVGFVGAVEVKQALRASGLPALSNRSEKGGPAVVAAAVNALVDALAGSSHHPDDPADDRHAHTF